MSQVVTQVIGVGSPHGDDAVAWHLIERLRPRGLAARIHCVATPAELLHWVRHDENLLLVDGCRTGQTPGAILRFAWPHPALRGWTAGATSSHGLALPDVLGLLEALGRLPPQVVIYGVEVGSWEPGSAPGQAIAEALDELERRVWHEITRGTEPSPPYPPAGNLA